MGLNVNKPVAMVVGLVIVASLLSATIGDFVVNFTAAEAAGLPTWVETLWYIFIGLGVAGLGYIYAKKSGLF